MIREKLEFQDFINVSTDVLTILLSYVLAVFLRYEVMPSKPGLNTLSAPYLLIATAYSIILASVFQFLRSSKGSRVKTGFGYEVFSINAIGCLFLLAFFYMIGETYFSRLAMIIFWLISSLLLEVKWIVLSIIFDKKHLAHTQNVRVLIVGGGHVTYEYIRAVGWDEACGFNIIGYVGTNYGIFFDYAFGGVETNDDDLLTRGWLGEFAQFEDVIEREKPDEVVFALEDAELSRLSALITTAKKKGVKTSLVSSFNELIPKGATIDKINNISIIDLSDDGLEKTSGFYAFGLTLTSVFLILMLVIKRFNIGAFSDPGIYENYRCLIFAVTAFFGYQCFGGKTRTKHSNTVAALITIAISLAVIVVYELIYTQGAKLLAEVISDLKMTVAVVTVAWIIKSIVDFISKDDAWNMM